MSQETFSDTLIRLDAFKRIFVFGVILTSSFLGFFVLPGLLRVLKSVSGDVFGHTDSIENFLKNSCICTCFWLKMTKF